MAGPGGRGVPGLAVLAGGCLGTPLVDGDEVTEGSSTSTSDAPSTTVVPGTSTTQSTGPTTADDGTTETGDDDGVESTDSGSPFLIDVDAGGRTEECSIWEQDCPLGEKCMPWANDGGNAWNATRCSPLAESPGAAGEPCLVQESGVSGIDDCALGAMCWNVDPETNAGECVAFCTGSPSEPTCTDANIECSIANESVLALCIPPCDPLAQDCDAGDGCYVGTNQFQCYPDDSGDAGAAGDPCGFVNDCDPGLFCANASLVPDCAGSSCCDRYCDLGSDDPDAVCAPTGQVCVPWYGDAEPPTQFANVGACSRP